MMKVFHPRSTSPFSLCMYGAAYSIAMPRFLQKERSLMEMNSSPPSARNAFIKQLDLVSTFGSQAWKASTKLSFPQRYSVQVFRIYSHMRIATYVLLGQEGDSCGPKRLACTYFSSFVVTVMLLFCLTTRVDLLPTHSVHSLSRLFGLSSWQKAMIGMESGAG